MSCDLKALVFHVNPLLYNFVSKCIEFQIIKFCKRHLKPTADIKKQKTPSIVINSMIIDDIVVS